MQVAKKGFDQKGNPIEYYEGGAIELPLKNPLETEILQEVVVIVNPTKGQKDLLCQLIELDSEEKKLKKNNRLNHAMIPASLNCTKTCEGIIAEICAIVP